MECLAELVCNLNLQGTTQEVLTTANNDNGTGTDALLSQYLQSATPQGLINRIDKNRWYEDVKTLTEFGCRYSFSPKIKEVKNWLLKRMGEIPHIKASEETFLKKGSELSNIIGHLPATTASQINILIGGHYDSTSEDPLKSSPGALDNASGTAGVLEIARTFADTPTRNINLIFVLFIGEEQGYYGSLAHIHKSPPIQLMINLDMIGWNNPNGNSKEIETDPNYEKLAKMFQTCSQSFCQLPSVISLDAWGSDHVTFLRRGIPALLTTNINCVSYPYYHTSGDILENIDVETSMDFLVMNVVVLGFFSELGVDPRKV